MSREKDIFCASFVEGIDCPPRMTPVEWADRFYTLPPSISAEGGRYRSPRTPHMIEPMEALSLYNRIEKVVMKFPSQTGKSLAMRILYGYIIAHAPCPVLFFMPKKDATQKFIHGPIRELEKTIPCVAERMAKFRKGEEVLTLSERHFKGGIAYFGSAGSPSDLAQITVRVVIGDEIDRMEDVPGEGNPLRLAEKRATTYGARKKIFFACTPTDEYSRIEDEYLNADQHSRWIPCPKCGGMQMMWWGNLHWGNERPINARYKCSHCGEYFDDVDKNTFLARAVWRPWIEQNALRNDVLARIAERTGQVFEREPFDGQPNYEEKNAALIPDYETTFDAEWIDAATPYKGRVKSWHFTGLQIPYGWDDWNKLAAEYQHAVDTANENELRTFYNTRFARAFHHAGGEALRPGTISEAFGDDYAGALVPLGVGALTCAVDVQDNRLEALVVGHGDNFALWHIEHEVFLGDPGDESSGVWHSLREWISKLRDGLTVSLLVIDSGGHHTNRVYDWVANLRKPGRAFATKGANNNTTPMWPVYVTPRTVSKKGKVLYIGVNAAKEILFGKLKLPRESKARLHFPNKWASQSEHDNYFAQLTSEKRVVEYEAHGKRVVRWKKTSEHASNEVLDLWVYSICAHSYLRKLLRLKDTDSLAEKRAKDIVQWSNTVKFAPKTPQKVPRVSNSDAYEDQIEDRLALRLGGNLLDRL